jgi:uncharacterized ubiquitin-like protein YukD
MKFSNEKIITVLSGIKKASIFRMLKKKIKVMNKRKI